MLGDMPEHIRKRHTAPEIGSLDDAVLPIAPPRPVEVEILPPRGEARDAVLDSSAKLDEITELAMQRLKDVLIEPASDLKELAIQMDGIRIALTTQLRVDDTRLKKRQTDTLAELLKRMDSEEAKLLA
jgi:hypothetical protein